MAKQMTGRIRHVALSVQDPWETAEFYKEALGLEEVTELDGALAEGVFLTQSHAQHRTFANEAQATIAAQRIWSVFRTLPSFSPRRNWQEMIHFRRSHRHGHLRCVCCGVEQHSIASSRALASR